MHRLEVSDANLTAALSVGFLTQGEPQQQQQHHIVCQPNTKTLIGKQRRLDTLLPV